MTCSRSGPALSPPRRPSAARLQRNVVGGWRVTARSPRPRFRVVSCLDPTTCATRPARDKPPRRTRSAHDGPAVAPARRRCGPARRRPGERAPALADASAGTPRCRSAGDQAPSALLGTIAGTRCIVVGDCCGPSAHAYQPLRLPRVTFSEHTRVNSGERRGELPSRRKRGAGVSSRPRWPDRAATCQHGCANVSAAGQRD